MTVISELETQRQAAIAAYRKAKSDRDIDFFVRRQVDTENAILAASVERSADLKIKASIWRDLIADPASILVHHLPMFDQFMAEAQAA